MFKVPDMAASLLTQLLFIPADDFRSRRTLHCDKYLAARIFKFESCKELYPLHINLTWYR